MFTFTEVLLIIVLVSCIVGYIAYNLAQFIIISKMLDGLSDEELDKLTKNMEKMSDVEESFDGKNHTTKTLVQEVISGQTFLYDEHNNFVAQGDSASEAAAIFFNSRHTASVAIVKCGEGNSYKIVNGKIEA